MTVPWVQSVSDEQQFQKAARTWAKGIGPRDLVLLAGPMGVGKSIFARAVLTEKFAKLAAEGSPTFPIAHDYGPAIHADLYRVESEDEATERGLPETLGASKLVLVEWPERLPDFIYKLFKNLAATPDRKTWWVELSFGKTPLERQIHAREVVDRVPILVQKG